MKSTTLRNVLALVALLTIAALVFIASRSDTAKFEIGSPEATVQSFLQAMVDRDNDLALSFLEPTTKCDSSDLDRQYISPDLTVDLLDSSVTGERAQVKIRTRYSNDDLFGGWSEDHSISLSWVEGSWRISGTPWPLYQCDGVKP
jgi:hypothetical protein